jgi:hypothetical protein
LDLRLVALLQDLSKKFRTLWQKEIVENAIVICRRGWRRKDKIVKETMDKEVMRQMWEDYKERKVQSKEG